MACVNLSGTFTTQQLAKLPSGLYTADVDGCEAVIGVDYGKGFTITVPLLKRGWFRVDEYDSDGDLIGNMLNYDPEY